MCDLGSSSQCQDSLGSQPFMSQQAGPNACFPSAPASWASSAGGETATRANFTEPSSERAGKLIPGD